MQVTEYCKLAAAVTDRHDSSAGGNGRPHRALADDTRRSKDHDRRLDCPIRGIFSPASGTVTGMYLGAAFRRLTV